MSTHALVRFFDVAEGAPLVTLYVHADGHPESAGADLAGFLVPVVMTQGVSTARHTAAGAGCLAAQYIARFKTCPGDTYVVPYDTKDMDQDYEYEVTAGFPSRGDSVKLVTVYSHIANGARHRLFSGDAEAFAEYCAAEAKEGK